MTIDTTNRPDRPSAHPDYALGYVHAGEGARIDFERRYFPADDHDAVRREWWQHTQSYQPWNREEARHHAQTALQCINRHDHPMSDRSQLTRENCGACVLNGYVPRWTDPTEHDINRDGPNYAGWARIYVEAGRIIPVTWREAFAAQGRADNQHYYDALGRSLVTFGARFGA